MPVIVKKKNLNEEVHRSPAKSIWLGIGSAMASALIFGFNPLFVKIASSGGCNDIAFIFYSTIVSIIILMVLMWRLHIPLLPEKKKIMPILITGLFASITTILLFSSYSFVASGIATTLHFTYPTFVAVGGIFVLRERLTKGKVAALIISLAGIYLAADFAGMTSLTGIMLALCSGMTYAGYILAMDKTGVKNMNFIQLSFYMVVIKMVMSGIYGVCTGTLNAHMNTSAWTITVVYSILNIAAMVLFQVGVRYSGSSNAAIFSMFEPVTSLIVGFVIMHEAMTLLKWLGCGLILSGIVVTVIEERKNTGAVA